MLDGFPQLLGEEGVSLTFTLVIFLGTREGKKGGGGTQKRLWVWRVEGLGGLTIGAWTRF